MEERTHLYDLRCRGDLHKRSSPGGNSPRSVTTKHNRSSSSHGSDNDVDGSFFEHSNLNQSLNYTSSTMDTTVNSSGDNSLSDKGTPNKSSRLYPQLEKSPDHVYPDLSRASKESVPCERSSNKLPEQKEKSNNCSHTNLFMLLLVLLVPLCVYYTLLKPSAAEELKQKAVNISAFETFVQEINLLQQTLPKQRTRLWSTVKSATKHVLNETNPEYPVVILLASEAGHSEAARCVATKVAAIFQSITRGRNSQAVHSIDMANLKDLNGREQKSQLDEAMLQAFSSAHGSSFVLHNVHKLSAEGALLLHKYCDGDNALYKDVMIVFTAELEDQTFPYTERGIEEYLVRLWTAEMHEDKVRAVMSRVANCVGLVSQEESSVYDGICA